MAIPGSNLLKQARKVIKFTNIQYMKFGNRILDSNRNWVNDFFPAVPLSASVQAVRLEQYQLLGLDFQKQYCRIWASENLIDLDRDYSGDKFIFNNAEWKLVDNTNWVVQDGWASALAIKIKANP